MYVRLLDREVGAGAFQIVSLLLTGLQLKITLLSARDLGVEYCDRYSERCEGVGGPVVVRVHRLA